MSGVIIVLWLATGILWWLDSHDKACYIQQLEDHIMEIDTRHLGDKDV